MFLSILLSTFENPGNPNAGGEVDQAVQRAVGRQGKIITFTFIIRVSIIFTIKQPGSINGNHL